MAFHLGDFEIETQKNYLESQPSFSGESKNLEKREPVPWPQEKITYAILNRSSTLSPGIVKIKIRLAFDRWSTYIPREFEEIADGAKADIKISFVKGEHGDDNKFSGRGGEVAHAKKEGILHFDDDENWKDYNPKDPIDRSGVDFFNTAIHEIGHVLGLDHPPSSANVKSIMARDYANTVDERGYYEEPRLTQYDIDTIRGIYGTKIGSVVDPKYARRKKRETLKVKKENSDCSILIPKKDIMGNNLKNITGQPQNCCQLCKLHSKCKAFVWTDYEGGTCWLKSATQPAFKMAGSYMGIP